MPSLTANPASARQTPLPQWCGLRAFSNDQCRRCESKCSSLLSSQSPRGLLQTLRLIDVTRLEPIH
jgi:hypothetical protein